MLYTRRVYTETIETKTFRIQNDVARWYFLGIPVLTQKQEVWRKGAAVDDKLRARVLFHDAYMRVYCGVYHRNELTIDHRVPQIQGGVTTWSNLLTACRSCNSSKSGRTPEEANMPLAYGRYLPDIRSRRAALRGDKRDYARVGAVIAFLDRAMYPAVVVGVMAAVGGIAYAVYSGELWRIVFYVVVIAIYTAMLRHHHTHRLVKEASQVADTPLRF